MYRKIGGHNKEPHIHIKYNEYEVSMNLKEKDNFQKVKIRGLSIQWENGADICLDELYENSKKQI